jgi:hypothetical protein
MNYRIFKLSWVAKDIGHYTWNRRDYFYDRFSLDVSSHGYCCKASSGLSEHITSSKCLYDWLGHSSDNSYDFVHGFWRRLSKARLIVTGRTSFDSRHL